MVQLRAANGTLVGKPEQMSVPIGAMGIDSHGNATMVGVGYTASPEVDVSTRPAAGPSFIQAAKPIGVSALPIALVGLVVDPDGAADVTWVAGSTLYQAVRGPGANATFGKPTAIASDAFGAASEFGTMGAWASNAAGRAVVVYYDKANGYSAAIREPGGAFGKSVDFTGPLKAQGIFSFSAAGVAADGNAAILAENMAPAAGSCGALFSMRSYTIGAHGSTWKPGAVFGGTHGDSVAYPTLVGGPGKRIDVAWTDDLRSAKQECGPYDPYSIQAGTLGGPVTTIFNDNPPALINGIWGDAHSAGYPIRMALNSCGDGALIVGIADDYSTQNGLFTSTTKGCALTGPSSAQIKAALLKSLPPSGNAARIGALVRNGGYSFKLNALAPGSAQINWNAKNTSAVVALASGSANFTKAGSATVKVALTTTGKHVHQHANSLPITIHGSFTPTGKTAVIASTTFTLTR
jgi:hypothetical protein